MKHKTSGNITIRKIRRILMQFQIIQEYFYLVIKQDCQSFTPDYDSNPEKSQL